MQQNLKQPYIWIIFNPENKMKKTSLTLAIVSALTLSACGGSSSSDDDASTPPTNSAPTDITLSASNIDENMAGATIGTLTVTDADAGDAHTFTVDNTNFTIDGNELKLADDFAANFEDAQTLTVNVTAQDSGNESFSKAFTINVNDLLETYTFSSKFMDGESSVSYTGQTARHVLIAELNHYIGNQLKDDLDNNVLTSRADVLAKLNSYFNTSEEQYDNFALASFDNAKQGFIAEISSSHKNLVGKLAGNDDAKQHKKWNDGDFAGWNEKGSITPQGLVEELFDQLADNAATHLSGTVRQDVSHNDIDAIYLNTDGTDLKQLIQKFLLMAVTYSQGTDDYLEEGLSNDNIEADKGTKPYSSLEHQFDEGFGYFGAARDYLYYTDNEIAGKVKTDEDGRADWNGQHDTDGDGKIDLTSEIHFGQAINAAKRDRGTKSNANPTDFTQTTMEAFIAGRMLINEAAGTALTEAQMTELLGYRDIAVGGWEKAIAATVVHYINDTHADLDKFGTDEFDYADLAKHWSEMKGFALGLQFNPHSDITDEQFEELHSLMGVKPVLDAADIEAYQADLLKARDILAEALSFDDENVEKW